MPDGTERSSLIRCAVAGAACLFLVAAFGRESQAVGAADGVVAVTAYTNDAGRRGTGFILAPGGEIVTCYHTVVGAVRLEVEIDNKSYEARVERLVPNHDLAALRIKLPKGAGALPIYEGDLEQVFQQDLKIIGHSVGLRHLVTSARMAKPDWVASELLRVDGKRLFSSGARLLILEAGAVHDGMSGAPVLFGQAVVGVLCGSLSEGGDFAWGMDVSELFTPTAQRPRWPIRHWPEFALPRTTQWRDLLRNASLDNARGAALVQYFADWEVARESYMDHLEALAQVRDVTGKVSTIISGGEVPRWLLEEQAGAIVDSLKRARAAKESHHETSRTAFDSGWAIYQQVWDLATRMPRTQENLAVLDKFMEEMRASTPDPIGSAEEMIAKREARERDDKRIEEIAVELDTSSSILPAIIGELSKLLERGWRRAIDDGEGALKVRNDHAVVGKLLFLDAEAKPWLFRGKDYELTFPAGWALARARDQDDPDVAERIRGVERFYADHGVDLKLMAGSLAFPQMTFLLGQIARCGPLQGFEPLSVAGTTSAWVGGIDASPTLFRKIIYACRGTAGYYLECVMPQNKVAEWGDTCLSIAQTMRVD
jgi:hypothetical protein